jgi:hypothetical protein
MRKHNTLKKITFSKKCGGAKCKRSSRAKSHKKKYTKRIFFHRKNKTVKQIYRGGDEAKYPAVYGIENRSVLYPISKYGIPAGPFDPPALSNGSNGNGPYPGVLYGVYGGNGGSKRMRSGSKHKPKRRRSGSKRSGKVRRSKYHVGGGSQSTFLPQPLVNATRSLTGGLTEIANGFGGYTNSASLNPMPYDQPELDPNVKYVRTDFPNVAEAYNKADGYVSTTF